MEQDTELPEKFTTGVWYDLETGDSCRIVETEDSIGLVEPDRPDADPYYTFDEDDIPFEQALDHLHTDFYEIPALAQDDPARYVSGVLDDVQHDQYGRSGGPSMEEKAGLSYARNQVTIEPLHDE